MPALIDKKSITELKDNLKGKLLLPHSFGYNKARTAWNLTIEQYPAIIIEPKTTNDIAESVKFAKKNDLKIAVQSTGHGVIYPCNEQMLIITSSMKKISIDAEKKQAKIEAGAFGSDVAKDAQKHKLAPLSGFAPGVGIVGYTIGGGFGWLLRKYGLAVDSLLSVDMVTMNGEALHITPTSQPELFNALGGGGTNLGIITAIEIKLFPVDKIYTGKFYFPAEEAQTLLPFYARWVATLPEELTSTFSVAKLPPAPGIPSKLVGKHTIVIKGCYLGSEEDGLRLFQPVKEMKPLVEELKIMKFDALVHFNGDPPNPQKIYLKAELFNEATDDFLNIWAQKIINDPITQNIMFEMRHTGNGAMSRQQNSSLFSHRDTKFILNSIHQITDDITYEKAEQNIHKFWADIKQYTTGNTFPGFLGDGDDINRVKAAYNETSWNTLQKLQQQCDPEKRLMSYINKPL